MSNLEKDYEEITKQRQRIIEEMNNLEENEVIKRYFELRKQNESLYKKQVDMCKSMKLKNYKSCKHILVYSKIDYDRYEGRTYKSCGCIKCGLDNSVLDFDRKYLPFSKQVMYDYLTDDYLTGKQTDVVCDLDLAQAIYSKIKENNPKIDDETATKYFEIALDNIRNIKVSDDRKTSRVKRLSLDSGFKRWNSIDVHTD